MSGIEKRHVRGAAVLTGRGTLTAAGFVTHFGSAALTASRARFGSATLTGRGTLVADGVVSRPA